MCHDHDSRPPAPPRSGDVAERGTLTLTSADGTEFSAAYAAPADEPRVGVVVLPDIRGLHPYYVALAEQATPVEDQLALAETMRSGGAEVETAVYDGAPHSFFDRAFGEWEEACADAWRRILALADRVAA